MNPDSLVAARGDIVVDPEDHSSNTLGGRADAGHPPDYVLLFHASKPNKEHEEQLERLVRELHGVGLEVECRYSGQGKVLVFVRCPEDKIEELVLKSRYDLSISGRADSMKMERADPRRSTTGRRGQ